MKYTGKTGEHGTVTITAVDFRDEFGACARGLVDNAKLFPMVLSSNPDENIEIANAMIMLGTGRDARWFVNTVVDYDSVGDPACYIRYTEGVFLSVNDAWIVAQWLAAAADALLTGSGR